MSLNDKSMYLNEHSMCNTSRVSSVINSMIPNVGRTSDDRVLQQILPHIWFPILVCIHVTL